MVSLAQELELNLPGTKGAFRAGIVSQRKAAVIASATAQLDPAEARAAEDKVLDRAGTLTPPALRAAIQRAVMEVAPNKAKQRREHEAKKTRVERWTEASGNAGLAGRELPPAQVLAADQRVTAWAKELRKAGLEGGMDRCGPDLARDLAAAAARNPRSTWCVTVTDKDGHAVGHGCARPARRRKPGGHDPPGSPGFTFIPTDHPGPPGGYGTWRFTTGQQDLLIEIGPIPTGECDHRWEARGHDPGVMLRHLTQVRNATCTGPDCRRPAGQCDFEHNIPYEAGGRSCLCNGNPKCRHDHRLKQHPRWNADQLPGGYVRWTTPSGRQYVTEPTRYPV
jgi:hypothetical protein